MLLLMLLLPLLTLLLILLILLIFSGLPLLLLSDNLSCLVSCSKDGVGEVEQLLGELFKLSIDVAFVVAEAAIVAMRLLCC